MRRRALLSVSSREKPAPYANYLTMIAEEDGFTASLSTNACEYRIGEGAWTALSAATAIPAINTGEYVSFRGNLTPTSSAGIGTFTIGKKCRLEGNCMSMLFNDSAKINKSLSGKNYAFYRLFKNCTKITSIAEKFIPAITLSAYCYREMFYGCTGITAMPQLPATTIATYCYREMFRGCTQLKAISEMPATTLQVDCYSYMFYGCTGLINAGITLPAKAMKQSCYNRMFYNCQRLEVAPIIQATSPSNQGCLSMFYNCIKLEKAPDLLFTSLTTSCCQEMFKNCSSLKYIKAMFTTAPSSSYTSNWVSGVASSGVFVKNAAATWDVTGVNGVPEGWTIETE